MNLQWKQALETELKVQRILVQQEINGFNFDLNLAKELLVRIEDEQNQIYNDIRPKLTKDLIVKETKKEGAYWYVNKVFTTKGEYTAQVLRWLHDIFPDVLDYSEIDRNSWPVAGPFTRIDWVEPEFSKREKLGRQLIRYGWKPELFTETGQPMLTIKGEPVESLERVEGDIGKGLARWFTLGHRRGVIEGWTESIREDGRLTPYCTGGCTNTYRKKHRLIANVPKARDNVVLGKEMRSLFIASPGTVLVGHDAAGLEARVEGHYTFPYDDGEYANELLKGDIHTKNMKWISEIYPIDRDIAKNIKYGLIGPCKTL